MPVELAADFSFEGPKFLAVSATHVYWMDIESISVESRVGSLRRIPKNGGTVQTLHTGSDVGYPGTLDIYNDQIYWGTNSFNGSEERVAPRLLRANLNGTDRIDFAPVRGSVTGVQVVGDVVYWSENLDSGDTLFRKSVSGTSAPEPVVSGLSHAWVSAGNCLYYYLESSLRRTCGDATTDLLNEFPRFNRHSPSDTSMLYFGVEGAVMRVPLVGSEAPTVVVAASTVKAPLVDGDFIYYIDGSTGGAPACTGNWSINRSGKTPGSTAMTVVPAPIECPDYLTDDTEALYWLESWKIRKVAKP